MAKPNSVFLDADAVIALNVYRHSNYKRAVKLAEVIKDLRLEVFTCTYVILEAATIINMRFEGGRGVQVASQLLEDPLINVIKGDEFLGKGLEKMKTQKSKNVSLNDCVYFAIVDELKIDSIFSFDKHWKKNGYTMLQDL